MADWNQCGRVDALNQQLQDMGKINDEICQKVRC